MLLLLVPVVVFVGVTLGIRPGVNLVARLRSPHSYSEYDFAGTWVVGLLAASVAAGIEWSVTRRRRRST